MAPQGDPFKPSLQLPMNHFLRHVTLAFLGVLPLHQLGAQGTLKIFLLAGQSNQEGQAYTYDSNRLPPGDEY